VSELPAVPDYYGQFMAPLQRQQALNIQQQQVDAETAQRMAQAQAAQAKAQAMAQYQHDAAAVIANPSPEGFRSLLLQHPEMHEGLKTAWDTYSEGEKNRDVGAASQVYAALSNGRSDVALQLLKDRKTALNSSGGDDKLTDSMIEMLESGDPAKVKQVQGMAGFVLANSAGPDKIGSTLEALNKGGGEYTLSPGSKRFDAQGNVVAEVPFAPQYRELDVTGADGQTHKAIVRVGGDGQPMHEGGAQGGFGQAVAAVLKNEGGYNPSDMNGAPVNFGINQKANPGVDVKNLTREKAIQIYHDKYWVPSGAENLPANLQTPYFDVYIRNPAFAKKALAQSGGDPAKFMQASSAYFQKLAQKPSGQKYAKAWANRDANNMAIALARLRVIPTSWQWALRAVRAMPTAS
jgi:hypothetical protein